MNEAFEKWRKAYMPGCDDEEEMYIAVMAFKGGEKATELRVSKALGGMPESELWGDDGLIAATMRIVDAYEAATTRTTKAMNPK